MDELTEMIADAMAEEEVAKANGYSIPKFDDGGITRNINVNLEEYIMLRKIRDDHIKLLDVIERCLRVSSYGDDLRFENESLVIDFYRAVYPDAYEDTYRKLKAKKEAEEE